MPLNSIRRLSRSCSLKNLSSWKAHVAQSSRSKQNWLQWRASFHWHPILQECVALVGKLNAPSSAPIKGQYSTKTLTIPSRFIHPRIWLAPFTYMLSSGSWSILPFYGNIIPFKVLTWNATNSSTEPCSVQGKIFKGRRAKPIKLAKGKPLFTVANWPP